MPVRTSPEELIEGLRRRARNGAAGRSSPRVTAAARAFGLIDEAGALTETGSALALGDDAAAAAAMREVLLRYPPYRALLDECAARGETTTRTDWAELWWGARGIGSSETNRREGMAMLGRLAQFAGLCSYVAGRRGYPSRLEWRGRPNESATRARSGTACHPSAPAPLPAAPADPSGDREEPVLEGVAHATLTLASGRTAELRIPSGLSADDRRRLRALLEVLMDDS